tara:strand:- start:5695 stop:5886 length:192 start_codon:yes stop_codon:yes gene_type:complete
MLSILKKNRFANSKIMNKDIRVNFVKDRPVRLYFPAHNNIISPDKGIISMVLRGTRKSVIPAK